MGNAIELTGKRFGRWRVIRRDVRDGPTVYWLCLCDCGRKAAVHSQSLRHGRSKGCRWCSHATHGATRVGKTWPEYSAWRAMRSRCENHTHPEYRNYGGRGIIVCDRWQKSFEAFIADMGRRPGATHSIDRINNDGNYEPGNCRWATAREQSRNRRACRMISVGGISLPLVEWSERSEIPLRTICSRLYLYGWDEVRAVTTPARRKQLT